MPGEPKTDHSIEGAPPESAAPATRYRPGVVILLSILMSIGVVWYCVLLAIYLIGNITSLGLDSLVVSIFFAVLIALNLSIALGIWHGRNWARLLFVIIVPLLRLLELLIEPGLAAIFGLVVWAVFAFLLFRPKTSAFFKGEVILVDEVSPGLSRQGTTIIRCPGCSKEIYASIERCHHCGADLSTKPTEGSEGGGASQPF